MEKFIIIFSIILSIIYVEIMNNTIHSIQFTFDYYPNPLETFEIAKNILEKLNIKKGIKEIQYSGKYIHYAIKPNYNGNLDNVNCGKGISINYICA